MKNIAIIGFGNIGSKRYQALKKIKQYEVKIIIDKKITNLKKIVKNKNIIFFEKYNDPKIKWSDINLCIISVNTNFAFEIARYILNKRIHILIEKPAVNSFKKLNTLYQLAQNKKILFKIGFNFMHDDAFPIMQNIFKYNLGRIYKIRMDYFYGTNLSNNNSVGSLLDVGLHLIYLSEVILPKSIPIDIKLNNFENKFYDENGLIFLIKNLTTSELRFSFVEWENCFNIVIVGEKGIFKWEGLAKWKNQKISFMNRVLPSGKPTLKFMKTFKKDNSFSNELSYIFDLLTSNNAILKSNKWDYSILEKIKDLLKLKYKNHPYIKS